MVAQKEREERERRERETDTHIQTDINTMDGKIALKRSHRRSGCRRSCPSPVRYVPRQNSSWKVFKPKPTSLQLQSLHWGNSLKTRYASSVRCCLQWKEQQFFVHIRIANFEDAGYSQLLVTAIESTTFEHFVLVYKIVLRQRCRTRSSLCRVTSASSRCCCGGCGKPAW